MPGNFVHRETEKASKHALDFDLVGYTEEEICSWDQRESMRPPPYKYAMARPAKGLCVGDSLMATVPTSELVCHGKVSKHLPRQDEPEWVDWDIVERGQRLWREQAARSFTALGLSLLSGFSISRFADILYKNGYAKDGETAMQRYRATGFFVLDFYRSSLRDPQSKARTGIANVRAMHEWARRNSRGLFRADQGEGIPLCQLDMAEVQLGFSGICMEFLQNELGAGPLTEADARAMVHCWRLIGYHLGIMDDYNVCNSLEGMYACVDDFMAFTPRRLETLRPSTAELRRTAMEGFGIETGLGTGFWQGAFQLVFETPRVDISHLRPVSAQAYPGMNYIARLYIQAFHSDWIARLLDRLLIASRDSFERDPVGAKRKLEVRRVVARFHDRWVWRLAGLLYIGRHMLIMLALFRVSRRVIQSDIFFPSRFMKGW